MADQDVPEAATTEADETDVVGTRCPTPPGAAAAFSAW